MDLTIVSPFPPAITGIGQYGFHISRALAESGQFSHITVLAGARTPHPKVEFSKNVTVEYAWQPDRLQSILRIPSILRQLESDLVWYNLGVSVFGRSPLANLLGFLGMGQAQLSGLPTVATLHELVELADLKTLNAPGGQLARFGAHWITNLATHADVVCLTMHRYMEWFSLRHPARRCMHIPIGAYQKPERLREPDIPELLFFTTLAPYKGLEILLEAYRSLLPEYPTLRLTIAGAEHPRFPGYGEGLRRVYDNLPGICWLGQVAEEQVRAMFSRAQIVVLPYFASTGSSSVLYQAAMWGRVLVASDLPETQTAAAENGLEVEFFKNRDAGSLADAIRGLLESPTRRRAQAGHNLSAIQRSRPEETCRLYLQAFNLALESRQSSERLNIPKTIRVEST